MEKKILCVCTANKHRSPTAAWLIKIMNHKSEVWHRGSCQPACVINGGTFATAADIADADTIYCMEDRNRNELVEAYGEDIAGKITVLNIEDKYKAFAKDLIEAILCALMDVEK